MSELKRLPEGWKWVKVQDICSKIIGGGTPSTSEPEYWKGDIDWITSADIYGLKDIRPRKKISKKAISESATNILPRGNIVVVTRVGLGKVAMNTFDICFSQDSQGLLLKKEIVTTEFVLWFLSQAVQIFKYKNRGTTINGVTKKQLSDLYFVLPPIKEQERIVEKIEELFSELDEGVENLKKAKSQLKIYRQAVLKYAFEGRFTHKDVKQGKLPEGWEKIEFGKIADFKRGPFGSTIKKEFFVPTGYKVYEQKNAIYNDFTLGKYFIDKKKFNELRDFEVRTDDYLVSCSGTIGKIFRIPPEAPKGVINQALLRIRIDENLITPKYFRELFESSFFQRRVLVETRGSAMLNIAGVKELKNIFIPLAPKEEQYQIVEEIESRLSVCDSIEKEITQALKQSEHLRQSILKQAFEGRM